MGPWPSVRDDLNAYCVDAAPLPRSLSLSLASYHEGAANRNCAGYLATLVSTLDSYARIRTMSCNLARETRPSFLLPHYADDGVIWATLFPGGSWLCRCIAQLHRATDGVGLHHPLPGRLAAAQVSRATDPCGRLALWVCGVCGCGPPNS